MSNRFRWFVVLVLMTLAVSALAQDHPHYAGGGSTYVPLDTWVYPAFDRLQAWGLVPTAFAGQRPWTRTECARLLVEAEPAAADLENDSARELYAALRKEFAKEIDNINGSSSGDVEVDRIYARTMGVAGTPLQDDFHFGQTLPNDFGRPTRSGANMIGGAELRASWKWFAAYVSGEYRYAGSLPAYPLSVRQELAKEDYNPLQNGDTARAIRDFQALDSYLSLNVKNFQFSFGKQSLWWGPSQSAPYLISDNAVPITMFRYDQIMPTKFPSIGSWLGPIRFEGFIGQLAGQHEYSSTLAPVPSAVVTGIIRPQPYISGEKISIKPTENLEMGFGLTTVFGGPGFPVTPKAWFKSILSFQSKAGKADAGDRRAGVDIRYRIPWARNKVTFNYEAMTEDEPIAYLYPRRAGHLLGLYFPQVGPFKKLELTTEGMYTALPDVPERGFFYYNLRYRSGYTNDGHLIGSWLGRDGRGLNINGKYWISPQTNVQAGYRLFQKDAGFLKGGSINDFWVKSDLPLKYGVRLNSLLQYERYDFPLLNSQPKSDFIASFEFTYRPESLRGLLGRH